MIFLELSLLSLSFSLPAADKIQYFVHLSFNSTLQLINGISSDLHKLINCTEIIAFFRISLALFGFGRASVFSYNLSLYLKDLKSSVFSILLLKLVALPFK